MPRAHDQEDEFIKRFRRTPEGMALNAAFDRIHDPRLRRGIIELAQACAREAQPSSPCSLSDGSRRHHFRVLLGDEIVRQPEARHGGELA